MHIAAANKALQLIHKSGAPVVAPLLLSTELNRYDALNFKRALKYHGTRTE